MSLTPDPNAVPHEGAEHRLRDVLVVERHHVDPAGEGEHRLRVAVVPDRRDRDAGGCIRGLPEHREFDAQLHRGRHHHAGELPSSDHADAHLSAPLVRDLTRASDRPSGRPGPRLIET